MEDGDHGEGHVGWSAVGPVGAESEIHVEEGGGVALEPAWLKGDGSAGCGPEGAVRCCWHAAACWGEMSVKFGRVVARI